MVWETGMGRERGQGAFWAAFFLCALLLLPIFPATAMARVVWLEGRVTRGLWTETHRYLEVAGVRYTLMPKNVRVSLRYRETGGRWGEAPAALGELRTGQKVRILTQGRRIYRIIIMGRGFR